MNVDGHDEPLEGTKRVHELTRARMLVEESREIVVIVDATQHVVVASRRAREAITGLTEGSLLSTDILEGSRGYVPYLVPYDLGGQSETLVYLSKPGDLAAYQELREGFTASVSHELRTPLARLLVLLESAELAGADIPELIKQSRNEVREIGELIDDVLFLSELESGKEIVSLGTSPAAPVLIEVAGELAESAERAGVEIVIEGDGDAELPLRPRMIRVIVRNLIENAIRYAGPNTTLKLAAVQDANGRAELMARDNGTGVAEHELPRLFERFYRADRARSSRGTGLGLAITKHIMTAADGNVEATETDGGGLTIRCQFSGPQN
jgi:two-component system phosphate regulon sensor histidine kinase PhoR